jgi:hypothetical protein
LDLTNFKGNEKKRNKEEECFGWWKSLKKGENVITEYKLRGFQCRTMTRGFGPFF